MQSLCYTARRIIITVGPANEPDFPRQDQFRITCCSLNTSLNLTGRLFPLNLKRPTAINDFRCPYFHLLYTWEVEIVKFVFAY